MFVSEHSKQLKADLRIWHHQALSEAYESPFEFRTNQQNECKYDCFGFVDSCLITIAGCPQWSVKDVIEP
ncbi:hypothetical protein CEXT_417781 [Caerostris extrusa]|uniref:Uncharacterized protein n=1 Tax=Caerostris extrusa TaxID=172846 RepID=A0AAV4NU80_CAEEX|nr:hypothetical protein CEXT_417781 [Caerostris extrusa]